MKAKDRVMDNKQINEVVGKIFGCRFTHRIVSGIEKAIAQKQDEISFKAGIKEIVDDLDNVVNNSRLGYRIGAVEQCLEKWQARLKEWGIE